MHDIAPGSSAALLQRLLEAKYEAIGLAADRETKGSESFLRSKEMTLTALFISQVQRNDSGPSPISRTA